VGAPDDDQKPLTGPEVATSLWRAVDTLGKSIDRMEKGQLSADDLAAVRVLLEQDRRTRWLWTTARTWALWVTAVVAGLTIGLDALKTVLKRLIT
jgi:hypothetical protein